MPTKKEVRSILKSCKVGLLSSLSANLNTLFLNFVSPSQQVYRWLESLQQEVSYYFLSRTQAIPHLYFFHKQQNHRTNTQDPISNDQVKYRLIN